MRGSDDDKEIMMDIGMTHCEARRSEANEDHLSLIVGITSITLETRPGKMAPGILVNDDMKTSNGFSSHRSSARKLNPRDEIRLDPKLKPKTYHIQDTRPDSKVLFLDINILDSTTGADAYHGDVYIEGETNHLCWHRAQG